MANNYFYAVDNANKADVISAKESPNVKRSVFPYGRSRVLTVNEGFIYPVDYIPIVPGDSLDLDIIANIVTANPFVSRQFSGMKVAFHCFFNKYEHEWKGWKNYATEGRRGNQKLQLPTYRPTILGFDALANAHLLFDGCPVKYSNADVLCDFGATSSLLSYLAGLAYKAPRPKTEAASLSWNGTTVTSNSFNGGSSVASTLASYLLVSSQSSRSFITNYDTGVASLFDSHEALIPYFNAIPFASYQRNYRDFYAPKELIKDNPLWFPDDEDDFTLPYAGGFCNCLSNTHNLYKGFSLVPNNCSNIDSGLDGNNTASTLAKGIADGPILGSLRCRQFEGDAFTTALPFLERGGQTSLFNTLFSAVSSVNAVQADGVVAKRNLTKYTPTQYDQHLPTHDSLVVRGTQPESNDAVSVWFEANGQYNSFMGVYTTMNQIQELAVMSLWSRRNAMASGDYNSLIRAHYGVDPNSEDRRGRYLGGTILRLNFDSVTQTSETSNTPLGSKVSEAYGSGSARIGHFEFSDFGAIMILASIVPDTFYTQGVDPWFDRNNTLDELPFPEFTSLPRANLLTKRLFFAGFSSTAGDVLFGYQERFLDYKYRDNRLGGAFLDWKDSFYRSMTFARFFTAAPVLNSEFVTCSPYNCRDDMYTVPKQPHFIMQFADSVRLVRSLPYVNKEANFNI